MNKDVRAGFSPSLVCLCVWCGSLLVFSVFRSPLPSRPHQYSHVIIIQSGSHSPLQHLLLSFFLPPVDVSDVWRPSPSPTFFLHLLCNVVFCPVDSCFSVFSHHFPHLISIYLSINTF